ncbi:PaaI family thioesterase [Adlercreutzia sp. ZJ242]|uniref:PaaI family thioesterase n=1 Tax=Adlercreutzia sp. ZJ242 TaxID=2709409 RepID=UPI001F154C81|nr:PaaI family thioesterase [Adlercreutzia sp. ZJ242]
MGDGDMNGGDRGDGGEMSGGGLIETLGVEFFAEGRSRVEARMPVTPAITQPFGFVHGGATIALLESVASRGSELRCDPEAEQPFGVEVHVRHRKSGREGHVRGVAEFDREEPSRGRAGGVKHFWNVTAYDDAGDVMSEGVVTCRVVPRAYVEQRDAASA